ncbi:MAG: hypothetical protein FWC76_03895 [Defluviitaleaceae bacterium]|nr:hypothetical protein [Defluviitaleaceae bacterium]
MRLFKHGKKLLICAVCVVVLARLVFEAASIVPIIREGYPFMASFEGLDNWGWHDIVDEQYRMSGPPWRQIGVGSTRSQVEADFARRRLVHSILRDHSRPGGIGIWPEAHTSLSNAGFNYYHVGGSWRFIEFEFDENDIVTRIRIGNRH